MVSKNEVSAEFLDFLKSELAPKQNTEQDQLREKALAELDKLGALTVKDDSVQFVGNKIVLPAQFNGNLPAASKFIMDIHKQEEEVTGFNRVFKYRPWDGAAAFQRALYRVFGTSGLGKATQTMFGKIPPSLISIAVGPNDTIQVPWGKVEMPTLDAVFTLDSDYDEEYGQLFVIHAQSPRKNRARIEALFDVVQNELQERSIYRGKAFNGAGNPEFLDLSWVNEDKVVYADETLAQLNANVWSLIEYTDAMRKLGMPLKRAVLLEGPFGTGKTLAGALTALKAQANGWTFILARPGKDDLFEVLNTAKLYAPAVVQFEDIDVVARGGSDAEISQLLDALDGIGNKGNGVVALFTTNYVEQIQKAVMRPGRIDSIIHIGKLDRPGVEKLIKSVVDTRILGDLDYDVVYSHVVDFLPAFVKEAVDRAVRFSLSRNKGVPTTIETDDIVNAAIGLQRQLELMDAANSGSDPKPALEAVFTEIAEKAAKQGAFQVLNGAQLVDVDGDYDGGKIRARRS
jgi:transitional endoplasmic reticulum ATPase